MELKFDASKTYAIALEGGGAKGAYQIGAWKALREVGVRFNAISGTSVGALNGSLLAMGDLDRATGVWENIRYSKVMDVEDEEMRKLFNQELAFADLKTFARQAAELIKNRGFDVSPLRKWISEVVDEELVMRSGIDFYIITYSLSDRKCLELRASDLEKGQLCDMLLASAYLPAFRNEKLGGKRYTDGGVQDAVPIHALVANGYRDIIVIRLFGGGLERHFKMPKDVNITEIAPTVELGGVLNFDTMLSRRNLTLGYHDAQRMLYGLYGEKYYIDRTWDERRAYEILRVSAARSRTQDGMRPSIREINEKILPKLARELDVSGDYYDIAVACLEHAAAGLGLPEFRILTDTELKSEVDAALHAGGYSDEQRAALMRERIS